MSRIDPELGTDEIAAIAGDAYIYAYPMLIGYAFFQAQVGAPADAPERQAVGRFTHFRELGSPSLNNKIPWINTDTLYSAVWLDLRAEPFVLTTPDFEAHRYQNVQANDWYTMCFFTRSTRNFGNASRSYLIAGPDWRGKTPDFVDEVAVAETQIVKLFTRIIVEGLDDGPAIHALQDRYDLRPLGAALGQMPKPVPPLDLPQPERALFNGPFFECAAPVFIGYFNALMKLAAIHPNEAEMFARFARIGIAPGAAFDDSQLTDLQCGAIRSGIDAARARIQRRLANLGVAVNGWRYPLDLRGGRAMLAGGADAYLRRAVLAKYAIWGPEAEEVVYMTCDADGAGETLDGARHRYTLRFDRPPPAKGFWSFTVYDAQTRLLAAHPSGRYKRGDRDADMVRDADGSLTLYLQHDSPGAAREANWLPVPPKAFQVVARLYWPEPEILAHAYEPPAIMRGE